MTLSNSPYNPSEYRKLIEYSKNLEKKGKSIQKVNKQKAAKLFAYSLFVYCHLNWAMKDDYLEIFRNFLNNRISRFTFYEMISERLNLNTESDEILEFTKKNERAYEFTELLEDILVDFDMCNFDDEETRLSGAIGISKTELCQFIEDTFKELEKLAETQKEE